jgi:hypothetical protein
MPSVSERRPLTLLVAAIALVFGGGKSTLAAAATDNDRPNILIITADQLRYDAVRFVQDRMAVYGGKVKIRTPNLDRLAAASVVFSQAYSQGLPCTPARGTLRSGNTIKRTGLTSNKALSTWTVRAAAVCADDAPPAPAAAADAHACLYPSPTDGLHHRAARQPDADIRPAPDERRLPSGELWEMVRPVECLFAFAMNCTDRTTYPVPPMPDRRSTQAPTRPLVQRHQRDRAGRRLRRILPRL